MLESSQQKSELSEKFIVGLDHYGAKFFTDLLEGSGRIVRGHGGSDEDWFLDELSSLAERRPTDPILPKIATLLTEAITSGSFAKSDEWTWIGISSIRYSLRDHGQGIDHGKAIADAVAKEISTSPVDLDARARAVNVCSYSDDFTTETIRQGGADALFRTKALLLLLLTQRAKDKDFQKVINLIAGQIADGNISPDDAGWRAGYHIETAERRGLNVRETIQQIREAFYKRSPESLASFDKRFTEAWSSYAVPFFVDFMSDEQLPHVTEALAQQVEQKKADPFKAASLSVDFVNAVAARNIPSEVVLSPVRQAFAQQSEEDLQTFDKMYETYSAQSAAGKRLGFKAPFPI